MSHVDLHLHTHHSDGSDTPEQVVAAASALGIAAIAITDHDTVSGVAAAAQAAHDAGIGFLTGVEISARFERNEVHVIGLGVDTACEALLDGLDVLLAARNNRATQILERLQALDIPIELEQVRRWSWGEAVSRMHIARELKEMGVTRNTQDAFDRFLNHGRPAHVAKYTVPAEDALDLIHAAGGLAFIAHPGLSKSTRKHLPGLLKLPFDGIEAYHVSHTPGQIVEFLGLASEYKILVSGGSDCHGLIKGRREMGNVQTPEIYYQRILDRLAKT